MTGYPPSKPSRRGTGTTSPWAGEVFAFPATVGQQGFWYQDQVDPGNTALNIAVRFQLHGRLRTAVLERALNEIVQRHEPLRTIFAAVDGQPVQVVATEVTIPLPVTDLRAVPEATRLARSEELTLEEGRRSFSLSDGPLLRAALLRLGDEDHVLLITVHHIVCDGWSIGLITDELGALYDAFSKEQGSPLPELPLQYGDFSIWQKQWLEFATVKEQLSYWTERLAALPLLEVPTDRPRPTIATSDGSIVSVLLPKALTGTLQELSGRQGCTFCMLALAALKILLQRATGKDDIFVGSLVAGRTRVELEPLIGLFVNPIVFRTSLSGDPTFFELLSRVRDTMVGAMEHQDVPFERIVGAVQPKRDPSRHPIFQINFIYQRDFVRPLQVSGLTLTALPSKSPGAIYDLNFFMVERADGWRASCEYNTNLYDAATVQQMLARFQALLEAIAADPARPISEIPMLTAQDRSLLLSRSDAGNSAARPQNHAGTTEQAHLAPRNDMETRLSKIWEELLGETGISINADFFDMGGHSMLAARMLAQTQREFGRRMSLASFLQGPTIESFAARIQDDSDRNRREQVHAIQPRGTLPPLFVVTSQPRLYRALAHRMGPDQPMFGLMGLDLPIPIDRATGKEIASSLVDTLRETVPHGPYYLVGGCNAGVIAYEMAFQLRARGEEVGLVALLDSNTPRYIRSFKGIRRFPIRLYLLLRKLVYVCQEVAEIPISKTLKLARVRIQAILEQRILSPLAFWRLSGGEQAKDDLVQSMERRNLAVLRYDPESYDGPVVLFRSRVHQTGRFRDPTMGWGELVGARLQVYELPGRHGDMLHEPYVDMLASRLRDCLSAARTAATEGSRAPSASLEPGPAAPAESHPVR